MPAALNSPTPLVDGPHGECLAAAAGGSAFRLQGLDDGHPAVADRPGSPPTSCGWVTSALGKTTRRTT